jgi:hypothetical protein
MASVKSSQQNIPSPTILSRMSKMIVVMGPVTKVAWVAPSTNHHGAVLGTIDPTPFGIPYGESVLLVNALSGQSRWDQIE